MKMLKESDITDRDPQRKGISPRSHSMLELSWNQTPGLSILSFLVFLVNQASLSLKSSQFLHCTAQSWKPISNPFTLSSQRCTLVGCSHQSTWWTKVFLSISSGLSRRKVEQHHDMCEEAASQGARAQGAACCFIPESSEESRCSSSHWRWWENVRENWEGCWGSGGDSETWSR